MRERPILMSGPMVRAILDGRKTQTRRVVKPQPHPGISSFMELGDCFKPGWSAGALRDIEDAVPFNDCLTCPYGQPGDRLWVRESWAELNSPCSDDDELLSDPNVRQLESGRFVVYRADTPDQPPAEGLPWQSSIFMPRTFSRLALELTGVRVERLQAITEDDAVDEGCEGDYIPRRDGDGEWTGTNIRPREQYRALWDSLNAKRALWESNPWVWVLEFRRVEAACAAS